MLAVLGADWLAGWVCRCRVSWLARRPVCWLAGWLAARWVRVTVEMWGWLAGWLAGWPAGRPAGWLHVGLASRVGNVRRWRGTWWAIRW